jgi:hypothetical protein
MIGTATKSTVGLWGKKLVVKALKRSFMVWVKVEQETLASNNKKKHESSSEEEENNEEERQIAEKIIESVDEELKLESIYENEGDSERKKFVVEFLPFIISSLGALPNKSINNFTRMIETATKNTVGLSYKKLLGRG